MIPRYGAVDYLDGFLFADACYAVAGPLAQRTPYGAMSILQREDDVVHRGC